MYHLFLFCLTGTLSVGGLIPFCVLENDEEGAGWSILRVLLCILMLVAALVSCTLTNEEQSRLDEIYVSKRRTESAQMSAKEFCAQGKPFGGLSVIREIIKNEFDERTERFNQECRRKE